MVLSGPAKGAMLVNLLNPVSLTFWSQVPPRTVTTGSAVQEAKTRFITDSSKILAVNQGL